MEFLAPTPPAPWQPPRLVMLGATESAAGGNNSNLTEGGHWLALATSDIEPNGDGFVS